MNFCNLNITDFNKTNLLTREGSLQVLVPLNSECIVRSNESPELLDIVNKYRTTLDGQIPVWLFKIKHSQVKLNKISGSDIIKDYCKWAVDNHLRIFLLGGKETSNHKSVEHIQNEYPTIEIDGYSPPYEPYPFSESNDITIIKRIRDFHPQIIFVGFGFGKQERWIDDHYDILSEIGVDWAVCCGGSFEFISGEIKRAPIFIQSIGLEGVWRLLMEPKLFRLKRLLVSFKIFKFLK